MVIYCIVCVCFFPITYCAQASLGAFPWESNLATKPFDIDMYDTEKQGCVMKDQECITQKKENVTSSLLTRKDVPQEIRALPRASEVFGLIDADSSLSITLPPAGASAGTVLEHAATVYNRLQAKHSPMTFKFGITHNPHWRWYNQTYGYRHCFDKFEEMVIIYASENPHGPAFLEASLIREFGSTMAEKDRQKKTLGNIVYCWSFIYDIYNLGNILYTSLKSYSTLHVYEL